MVAVVVLSGKEHGDATMFGGWMVIQCAASIAAVRLQQTALQLVVHLRIRCHPQGEIGLGWALKSLPRGGRCRKSGMNV